MDIQMYAYYYAELDSIALDGSVTCRNQVMSVVEDAFEVGEEEGYLNGFVQGHREGQNG